MLIDRDAPQLLKQMVKAIEKRCSKIASLLIERGAALNAATKTNGETPLHYAIKYRCSEIASLLIERGAPLNTDTKKNSETPLHYAIKNKNLKIASLLIDRGAYVPDCVPDCLLSKVKFLNCMDSILHLIPIELMIVN